MTSRPPQPADLFEHRVWNKHVTQLSKQLETFQDEWKTSLQAEQEIQQEIQEKGLQECNTNPNKKAWWVQPELRWSRVEPVQTKTGQPLGLSWKLQAKDKWSTSDAWSAGAVWFTSGLIGSGLFSLLPQAHWDTERALVISAGLVIGKVLTSTLWRSWSSSPDDLSVNPLEADRWVGAKTWVKRWSQDEVASFQEVQGIREQWKNDLVQTLNILHPIVEDSQIQARLEELKNTWMSQLKSSNVQHWLRVQEQVAQVVEEYRVLEVLKGFLGTKVHLTVQNSKEETPEQEDPTELVIPNTKPRVIWRKRS